jgi:hypothetical protein
MLAAKVSLEREQADWLRSIKGPDIYMAPVGWHIGELAQAGFFDIDCIYLRYKVAILAARKPGVVSVASAS